MSSPAPRLLFWILVLASAVSAAGPEIAGCRIFPEDHIWNTQVGNLPVHENSGLYVNTIGAARSLHPDFGAGRYRGVVPGIPYNVVSAAQPDVAVACESPESDPGPFPIPKDAHIEGEGMVGGDRHVLVLAAHRCRLYELFAAEYQPDGSWRAGSCAVFDLNSYLLRPAGWTSADAAGLPILPGLVRYEEVAAGVIGHAIRFTAPRTRKAYVWPARHHASSLTAMEYPPMGQRFRLRAGFPIDSFPPQARIILRALQKYGIMLADNGGPWFISGVHDERWDNAQLNQLKRVRGSDFEAVDPSSLMVEPDSGRARRW